MIQMEKKLEQSENNKQNKGWQCPICNRVFSPKVESCKKCNKNEDARNEGDTRQLLKEG